MLKIDTQIDWCQSKAHVPILRPSYPIDTSTKGSLALGRV